MSVTWIAGASGAVLVVITTLAGWRVLDRRADQQGWRQLLAAPPATSAVYRGDMTAGLPDPARRYFAFTIAEGTPLRTAAEIEMRGEIGLGTKEAPGYRPMRARQVLAPPDGLVWQLRSGFIAGSDGALPDRSWTRFWLLGLIPIVRASGEDHHRSACGRVIAEAAFWVPASLLPGDHVRWEPVDENTARARVHCGRFEQAVDITVNANGAPVRVVVQRWSNANSDDAWREQPFGGELSGFRNFDGFRLPTRVEGGNLIGTADYFPFFKANVTAIRFPATPPT